MMRRLRRLKAGLIRFRKAARPIVIMGLRRGGTTMVADAIAACRGVWHANEPCAVLPNHPGYALKQALLPPTRHSQFFALEGEALARFEAYFLRLLEAGFPELGTCRRPKGLLRADRVCLKVLNAPWMTTWFLERTDAQVLGMLRHPAAQALSTIRQGWAFPSEAYLERLDAIADAFSPAQVDLWRRIDREGSVWEKAILDWTVTSLPLRRAEGPAFRRVLYEDIVRDPAGFVDRVLVGACGLPDRDVMVESFGRPSGSSRMSEAGANAAIAAGDVGAILERWREKVDPAMARSGQAILDAFEVRDYTF